jgi:hypothetical protein
LGSFAAVVSYLQETKNEHDMLRLEPIYCRYGKVMLQRTRGKEMLQISIKNKSRRGSSYSIYSTRLRRN